VGRCDHRGRIDRWGCCHTASPREPVAHRNWLRSTLDYLRQCVTINVPLSAVDSIFRTVLSSRAALDAATAIFL
jgi:hypothetical protein